MFRKLTALLIVALLAVPLLVGPADAGKENRLWENRYQNRAGWARADTIGIGWGAGTMDTNLDTLAAATSDTTLAFDIEGCSAIVVTVVQKEVIAGSNVTYTVQVSDDRTNWTSITPTFSKASSSATFIRQVVYAEAVPDSIVGSMFGNSENRGIISTASYMRVIGNLGYMTGTDSTMHNYIVKKKWPLDPK
jgi:hypothetical protein